MVSKSSQLDASALSIFGCRGIFFVQTAKNKDFHSRLHCINLNKKKLPLPPSYGIFYEKLSKKSETFITGISDILKPFSSRVNMKSTSSRLAAKYCTASSKSAKSPFSVCSTHHSQSWCQQKVSSRVLFQQVCFLFSFPIVSSVGVRKASRQFHYFL